MSDGNGPITAMGNGNGNGDGRRADGTFAPGHKFARGNPLNRKAQKLRNAVLRAATKADVLAIFAKAIEQAKNGDPTARSFVFDRLLGRVAESELKQQVEQLWELLGTKGAGR